MHRLIAVALLSLAATTAAAQTGIGVSIGVSQPGVYGRIDIGHHPPPPVLYPQPIVVMPAPIAVYQRPIYLHVPPGHAKNWGKHCDRYAACGQPVYFVQQAWVDEQPGYWYGQPSKGRKPKR
jgi:hypothetical protein